MFLNDGHISLRAPEPDDLDALFVIENDPMQWSDGVTFAPVSRKQLWDYIQTYDGNIFSAGQLRLVIQSNSTDDIVGVIDLYDYDRINKRAYVGVVVAPAFRGLGLASRALEMLCNYCSQQLGLKQLSAVIRADNDASIALFQHNGFIVTGLFPEWIKRGNEWVDAVHVQRLL